MSDKLERQCEVMIELLTRLTFGPERLTDIVCSGKKAPTAYLNVYNALRGESGVTELARIAKVSQPTMSVILQSWADQGIIYNVGTERKPLYHRLMKLSAAKRRRENPKE